MFAETFHVALVVVDAAVIFLALVAAANALVADTPTSAAAALFADDTAPTPGLAYPARRPSGQLGGSDNPATGLAGLRNRALHCRPQGSDSQGRDQAVQVGWAWYGAGTGGGPSMPFPDDWPRAGEPEGAGDGWSGDTAEGRPGDTAGGRPGSTAEGWPGDARAGQGEVATTVLLKHFYLALLLLVSLASLWTHLPSSSSSEDNNYIYQ